MTEIVKTNEDYGQHSRHVACIMEFPRSLSFGNDGKSHLDEKDRKHQSDVIAGKPHLRQGCRQVS
jgi:hypothetical protein